MTRWLCIILLVWTARAAAQFTPLTPLPPPRIVDHADAIPGDRYEVAHLLDDSPDTEYASRGKGDGTFVVFEFSEAVAISAVRHTDRADRATVAESQIELLDSQDQLVERLTMRHVNQSLGDTLLVFPKPITAAKLRWKVSKIGREGFAAVGGAAMQFYAADGNETLPTRDRVTARALPFLLKDGGQPIRVTIDHPYAQTAQATLRAEGAGSRPVTLAPGANVVEFAMPAITEPHDSRIVLEVDGRTAAETTLRRTPVRPLTIYILPHSHTDIGYTEIQTAVETKQVNNLQEAIAVAQRTADYPEGARYVWNVEVLWAADLYLQRMDDPQRADLFDAVKKGQVVLNGMYTNQLTGLCQPEELLRLFKFSTQLAERTGVPIDAAMISDVPGCTWGTVTALASGGIRYFSVAPNYFDRIGRILAEWENTPFYWVGPDGQTKVLAWIPYQGYAAAHRYGKSMSLRFIDDVCDTLDRSGYPYDVTYIRWAGRGDNAVPDPTICDFVRDWNTKYAWPKLTISGTSEPFRALERKYGEQLPRVSGDWTPYWEDGAASSARETAMNRQSADRLTQAEALFAMIDPGEWPAGDFDRAWTNVLLYSEHTWGAAGSIGDPEGKATREQWEIKRSYAEKADEQSRALLMKAGARTVAVAGAVDVFNTTSWTRSELVLVPEELSAGGDRVTDDAGHAVASQRLRGGELAFVASEVPPFAARRFTVSAGPPHVDRKAAAHGTVLENGVIRVRVDEKSGGIVELTAADIDGNFVDSSGAEAINDYLYFIGDDVKNVQRNGDVAIRVGEHGPHVASLMIESDAPGCTKLVRELRVVAGQDFVQIDNFVDKSRLTAKSYFARDGKESVNFAFPMNVPDGQMRIDVPLGVMRPEIDQLAGSCKNWLTAGRWIDVSNAQRGVTCVLLDSPLVQVGGLTATMLNSQTNPDVWRKTIEPTQKFYAWVMNNHWGTNYRAYQEGPTTFRFILRPHRQFDAGDATRFATGFSQPLLVMPASASTSNVGPVLRVEPSDVIVTGLKPTDDGRGFIVRLFNAGDNPNRATLLWRDQQSARPWLSDTSEKPKQPVDGPIEIPARGLITLRVKR